MSQDQWRPPGPRLSSDDAFLSQGPGRILSTFNGFLDLARLVNDSIRAAHNALPSLLARFDAWQSCVPVSLQIIRSNGFQPHDETPHAVNFTLATASLYLRLLSSSVGDRTQRTDQPGAPIAQFSDCSCALLTEFVSSLPGLRRRFGENWMPPI